MLFTLLSTLAAIALSAVIMSFLKRKNNFPLAGQTAVITGGSQGLGLSVAKEFAKKGANVVIVAQSIPKLEKATNEIKATASDEKQRFLYLSYDLRSAESAPKILDDVTKWNNGSVPDIIFNCAGNCLPGFFASSSLETHRLQMDTIYWTSAYMAHAVLNLWKKPASTEVKPSGRTRHLIFTSSCLAFYPVAGYAAYSPAKAAMRAMADTLYQEVEVYNGVRASGTKDAPAADIKVHIVFPMGIQTPGYENEQKMKPLLTQKLEEEDKPQTPEELAKIITRDLEAGRFLITSNFVGNLMRGWGMGSSERSSIVDIFWNFFGSIVILFIGPDYLSKCRKWGLEKGMESAS